MPHLTPPTAVAIRAIRGILSVGYRKITTGLATSELLACTNLLLVGVIYGFIDGPIVSAIQFVVIPAVLLATVVSAARDFLDPMTRLHSAVALALSVPVGFMYFVWHGWISP
jgi:hypothetical protein